MIVKMKANEPIAWNIRHAVRRALVAGGFTASGLDVHVGPATWDTLDRETGGKCRGDRFERDDSGAITGAEMRIELVTAARVVHVYCDPKQAEDTVVLAGLTTELSPEVFA